MAIKNVTTSLRNETCNFANEHVAHSLGKKNDLTAIRKKVQKFFCSIKPPTNMDNICTNDISLLWVAFSSGDF